MRSPMRTTRGHTPIMADAPERPVLLRVPRNFHSVDDVLACAGKMDLQNVLVLSEQEDGSIVFLDSGLTLAECNWILDTMKFLLLTGKSPR